ncbi:MAG TPA: M56 family metallopeptidase [Sphingomicrobium sp.]|nr:M56 family metallopeptidase [Sphingomicrobium sp.]
MHVLLGIALKSVLIAGLALGLLQLMRHRSAAERSWVAHIGLIALVVLAFAPLVLPNWTVETPAMFSQAASGPAQAVAPSAINSTPVARQEAAAPAPARFSISPTAATMSLYALPAATLLLITLLALVRLVALRARADVLVDGHWLSALARAQRRMGFKHGTALLTSDELASPISWGLMRPVILLNTRAVEASGEAEAIIAHELAHVARMDWVKLLLARAATALFWFNPLVWVLAREAHQLREETADDAVLAADISDTDYAQLLVGVARHECPGLLLGAHGVAPSKSSLSRRVARVLDGQSVRGPAARSFAFGVFVGAVLVAAPLAALTLAPAGTKEKQKAAAAIGTKTSPQTSYYSAASDPDVPTDLGSIIADGVSTSVQAAVAAAVPAHIEATSDVRSAAIEQAIRSAGHAREKAMATAAVAIADARRQVPRGVTGSGLTPEYIGAMRAAAPHFRSLDTDDFAGMHAVGVTPEFARDIVAAGFPSIDADDLVEARVLGLTGPYIRAMRAAGVRGDLDDFAQLRTLGVDPGFVARARKAGVDVSDVDELAQLRALGGGPPAPPAPAHPPRPPTPPAPPGGWNGDHNDD